MNIEFQIGNTVIYDLTKTIDFVLRESILRGKFDRKEFKWDWRLKNATFMKITHLDFPTEIKPNGKIGLTSTSQGYYRNRVIRVGKGISIYGNLAEIIPCLTLWSRTDDNTK